MTNWQCAFQSLIYDVRFLPAIPQLDRFHPLPKSRTKTAFLLKTQDLELVCQKNRPPGHWYHVMSPARKSPVPTIRVLLADDHPIVREGLIAILRSEKDISVVAQAADGEEACALYDRHSPDVLMLDLRMPRKDGVQVINELMAFRRPKPRIIVMTTYETEADIRRALQAGAKSYLVKGASPEQILETVRKVAGGESSLLPRIASKFTESLTHPELSPRELQVLRQVAAGTSNKEIGLQLQITEHTVKAHLKSILTKLGAMGRTEAIAIATKRGLIPSS
jgi:two-component system, NarL family, response regulator